MKNNALLKIMTFVNDQALELHQEIANELNIKTFLKALTPHKTKEVLRTEMM